MIAGLLLVRSKGGPPSLVRRLVVWLGVPSAAACLLGDVGVPLADWLVFVPGLAVGLTGIVRGLRQRKTLRRERQTLELRIEAMAAMLDEQKAEP